MVKKWVIGLAMVMVMAGSAIAQERCFTFTGNVRDRAPSPDIVASMGDYWIRHTNFYKQEVVEGQAVSYRICVSPVGDMARLDSSTLYPVGGQSHPDGYPKPQAAYNFIYYNDPGVGNIILIGTADEYIQVVHDGTPINGWEVNKSLTVTHSHHSLYSMPLTYNGFTHYDWVSRIYIDGWVSEIDPLPVVDSDGDGVPDDVDNCPNNPNDQLDSDGDAIGDICDPFPNCGDPNGDCGPEPITYLPELDCEGIGDEGCTGRYSLDQMGWFDGDLWNWNQDFKDLMNSQHYSTPDTHPELWTPIKSSGLIADGPWRNTDYRLDRRVYSDGREFSMLNLLLQTGESVKYPTVYLANYDWGQMVNVWFGPINWPDVGICVWEGDDPHAECDGSNPNMNADGDPWNDISNDNPVACCRPFGDPMSDPWIDQINSQELTEDRINFVKWENTGEIEYGPKSYDGGAYTFIKYGLMQEDKNNMWFEDYTTSYAQNSPIIRYHFPSMITAIGDQTFTINYDEGTEDQLTVFASDVRDMPIIEPFSTYTDLVVDNKKKRHKKSKKKVKATVQQITVENIIVREVVDPLNPEAGNALVVQWPEPDSALFGGMQLRVYVGTDVSGNDDFLFLDAPAQAGTVVFPQDVWEAYKARMLSDGVTEMSMHLMYRVNSSRYQNRSNSYTTFQIQ